MDIHLIDKSIDVGIIGVTINELLTNSSRSRSGINNLTSNIKKITEKCLIFGVKNVFVSGLFCTTRADVSLLGTVHVLILDFCRKNCFIYIDNMNIKSDSSYKDKGKAFLADKFILYLNNIFIERNTYHPPKQLSVVIFDKQLNFFKWKQNYIYYKRIAENI